MPTTQEAYPNLELSDNDFSTILKAETDKTRLLKWGLAYCANKTTEGILKTVAVVVDNINQISVTADVPDGFDINMSAQECVESLELTGYNEKILAGGYKWIVFNDKTKGGELSKDAIPVASMLMYTARKYFDSEAK